MSRRLGGEREVGSRDTTLPRVVQRAGEEVVGFSVSSSSIGFAFF